MITNFQKVADFNDQFGASKISIKNLFEPKNTKFIENRMKLIREEVGELEQAIIEHNHVEVIDALADILYVTYGMGHAIGVDMDKVFDVVHKNNMSKLCVDEEEAKRTVEHYKNDALLSSVYNNVCYKLAPNQHSFVVYNESTKKILKSISWKPVDLKSFIN